MTVLKSALFLFALILPAGAAQGQSPPESQAPEETAIFAGGCFWCVEEAFDNLDGVTETVSGYTGGPEENPTYRQVASGRTGHLEAVRVSYNPDIVGYEQLLDVFWRNIDPVDAGGQFCDRGMQYTTAVFTTNDAQQAAAEASKTALESSGRFQNPIATRIVEAGTFYPAEDNHQNYHQENPVKYRIYKLGCGRVRRLEEIWGSKS